MANRQRLHLIERSSAAILLAVFVPAMLGIAAIIHVLSRRSPLVAHLRVGLRGEMFWMLKFRTMWSAQPSDVGERRLIERVSSTELPGRKLPSDPRVTSRFAAWCRTYSVDELPQLWNVVRGEMSLVGPRPLTKMELDEYYSGVASEVLERRPGITGLWQVLGRNELTYRCRRRLDLFLVRRYSLRLYWWILTRTPPRVLSGTGAW